ncbi:hypothetical protein FACS189437_08450 [Bacteroidia bacterium]|nr:hypothetical protein FACS189437_08450 [Bacteroidia bacterium]GHT63496.1 hypothetical protein FACS189451_10320 [Bacteroidia bacterium]
MIEYSSVLRNEIDNKIQEIELGEKNIIKKSLAAIEILSESMERLKTFIKNYTFENNDEEIRFFKEIKPRFLSLLIYYQKIYNLEMDCPTNNVDAKREYYKNELNRLDEYAQKRMDFVRYCRSGATNLDEGLFLRNQNYLHQYMDSFSFERDDAFSAVGDFRVAKLLANDKIQVYINSQLQNIENYELKNDNDFPKVKLTWTAKKTDLIELLYALDAVGCFNSGSVSLNQIAAYFENIFNTDLSNFPRDFYEMRIRNDQTPFMDKLKNLLKKRMDNPKKPYKD